MLRRISNICLVVTLSVTLVLLGCSKGPKGTFQDVKLGMTKAEVLKIIGEPHERGTKYIGSLKEETLRWRSGNQTLILTFNIRNRVSGKEIVGHAQKAQEG
jgi:hypothetical protein